MKDYDGKDLVCGVYYVEKVDLRYKSEQGHTLTIKPAFYSWNLVQYMLDKNHIEKSNIKYMVKASYEIESNTFKDFVEYCFTNFEEKHAKLIVNSVVGTFGKKYNKNYQAFITDDISVVSSCINHSIEEDGIHPQVNAVGGVFMICKELRKTLLQNHLGIYNHVISGGIINLLEICEKVPHDKIVSVRTDAVYYYGKVVDDESHINKEMRPSV